MNSHSDREWLVPMAVITAFQFAFWWALWSAGFARQPMVQAYSAISLIGLAAAAVVFVLWYLLRIYREGERQPLNRMKKDVRVSGAITVATATVLGTISASAFTSEKSALSFAVPFYLDLPIADFERSIFGGDAWSISQSLLGWATPLIDRVYLTWLGVMLIAFNLLLLSKPSAHKTRSLIAWLLTWPLVGTVGAYLLSSAGPIFHHALFGGSEFADLIPTLEREGASGTLFAYGHLWEAYSTRDAALGAGVSAMPSVHVAMACWLALTVRNRFPRFQWTGWTYFALIWLGSVLLGWHYASDGAVGALCALLIWHAAPHLAFRRQVPPAVAASSLAA